MLGSHRVRLPAMGSRSPGADRVGFVLAGIIAGEANMVLTR
jgi:hypothetical protein